MRIRRILLGLAAAFLGGAGSVVMAVCGPFSDVDADGFCPSVLEIFYLGLTTGHTPTTYDPSSDVTRLQMAAFLSRTVDAVLKRSSRHAALGQFWTPQNGDVVGVTTIGGAASFPAADGTDIWVPNAGGGGSVARVRASDGRLLEAWTAEGASRARPAAGGIIVAGTVGLGGRLYRINPAEPSGSAPIVASLSDQPWDLAFDGARVWTTNEMSLSIVTPGPTLPWTVTSVPFLSIPIGVLFDGTNIWVTDHPGNYGALEKLDSSGAVLQTVKVGLVPEWPVFDGANIWVPDSSYFTVSVVRAGSGTVLATLTGNGLHYPAQAAFDGERILVTNEDSVSLWKAADLSPLGSFSLGSGSYPRFVCSDGINFWITFRGNQLARF